MTDREITQTTVVRAEIGMSAAYIDNHPIDAGAKIVAFLQKYAAKDWDVQMVASEYPGETWKFVARRKA